MARKKKSIFDTALGSGSRGRKRRRSMADIATGSSNRKKKSAFDKALGFGQRKRKGAGDVLAGGLGRAFSAGGGMFKRSSRAGKGLGEMAGRFFERRLSRTERMEAQDAIERAMDDHDINARYRDAQLTQNESFIYRLARLVRERVGIFSK